VLQRIQPIGFRPWEISALANRAVIDIHVTEAAFLWMRRDRAVTAPHYRLRHLARLDRRIDGHLEGLRHAGTAGWDAAQRRLDQCDPGMVFVVGYLAFHSFEREWMRRALQLGLAEAAFADAMVASMAWHHDNVNTTALRQLAASPLAAHRRVALAAKTLGAQNPGSELAQAAHADDAVLRARALRAIGDLKRRDLLGLAHEALDDPDSACSYRAARALALAGDAAAAHIAWDIARKQPSPVADAIDIAMRCGDAGWAREQVRALAAQDTTRRLAVQAAGALGDPQTVPWLIAQMTAPGLARVAAEAFATLTGADLREHDLAADPPEVESAELDDDPHREADADLPWPALDAIKAWWSAQHRSFTPGQRYLAGHPIRDATVLEVLRHGTQRQRRAAAIERARLNEAAPLFPVAAHADWQRRSLPA